MCLCSENYLINLQHARGLTSASSSSPYLFPPSSSSLHRDGLTCDVNDLITQKDINMASSSSSSSTTMESNPQSSSASSSPLRTEDDIRAVFTDLKVSVYMCGHLCV